MLKLNFAHTAKVTPINQPGIWGYTFQTASAGEWTVVALNSKTTRADGTETWNVDFLCGTALRQNRTVAVSELTYRQMDSYEVAYLTSRDFV